MATLVRVLDGTAAPGDAAGQWGFTPDLVLLVAAAIMTAGVIIFGITLLVKAGRENPDAARRRSERNR